MRRHLTRILHLLEDAYGRAEPVSDRDPVATLIGCILSQNTSDTNSHRAHAALLARYGTYAALAGVPTSDLSEAIRCGGLATTKANTIQAALHAIQVREGVISLEFLRHMPTAEAQSFLMAIPGIGCKTAAIVLNFAFDQPILAVDTHVHRVLRRLGQLRVDTGPCKASAIVSPNLDPKQVYRFHIALLRHGKRCCRARSPLCHACPLAGLCAHGRGPWATG